MCVYIRIDPELLGRPRGASRTNPGMLVLVSPSRPPQLWPSSGTRWLIHVTHQLLCRAAGGETHSAAEQCFHQKTMGRATDMPGFKHSEKKGGQWTSRGVFMKELKQHQDRESCIVERQKHASTWHSQGIVEQPELSRIHKSPQRLDPRPCYMGADRDQSAHATSLFIIF